MGQLRGLSAVFVLLCLVLIVAGCPSSKEEPLAEGHDHAAKPDETLSNKSQPPANDASKPQEEPALESDDEPLPEPSEQPPEAEKTRDLGPPLVDNVGSLKRLDPDSPVWLDATNNRVVILGQICQTDAPLEMFACLRDTKEHEAIVAVPAKAYVVHAALLAAGAKAGHPVQFVPNYVPAIGSEVDITVHWKSEEGELQTARAQDWVRDVKTGKAMDAVWVFGGSGFSVDETTGQRHYQAEDGDFICVSNFTSAMLDLSIPSSQSNAELVFQAFTERIPPRDTPVTIIIKPAADPRYP